MDNSQDFIKRIEEKMEQYKISDYAKRSDEFEKGMLVAMEALSDYVTDTYKLVKKTNTQRKRVWQTKLRRARVNQMKKFSSRK